MIAYATSNLYVGYCNTFPLTLTVVTPTYFQHVNTNILICNVGLHTVGKNMGKWKCLWCSKVLEGESFMDSVTRAYVRGEPVHAWENITLVEEEKAVALVKNLLSV